MLHLHPSIQTSILDRFGDVGGLNFFRAGKVGDGAADLEDAAVGAGAQAQFVDGGFEKFFAAAVDQAVALEIARAHLGIGMNVSFLEALKLDGAGGVDALTNSNGGLAGVLAGELLVAQRRHLDLDVDTVEQGARDLGAVALDLQRRADAFLLGIGKEATGAGIHGGDEHETRRVVDRPHGARHGDVAVFQRLAHDFENIAPELRQLVEKEHPVVRQGNFAGPGNRSTADETRVRDRVVRRAKRADGDDRLAVEGSHDTVDLGGFQRFRERQIR